MGHHADIHTETAAQNHRASSAFSPVTLETYRDPVIESGFAAHPLRRVDFALAAVLFVSALVARSPFIVKGETLLHSDEAIVGIMAQDISEFRRFPIFFYGQRYMGALEAYVIAALMPVFQDPILALRLGPALFFGALCALQYLMLTRWFGRKAAAIGVAALIAGPPMFMQWSISARGGYIEILVWGTALLWAYAEWFTGSTRAANPAAAVSPRRKFIFGAILGSGMWINPSIAFFLLPIIAFHFLIFAQEHKRIATALARIDGIFGITTLPVIMIGAVLLLTCIWNVQVEDARVQSSVFFDLFPKWISISALCAIALVTAWQLGLLGRIRAIVLQNAHIIAGVLVGAAPALLYLILAVSGLGRLDPALPLGIRPLWKTGETLNFLTQGTRLMFGADPRPFETLVCMGQTPTVKPLNIEWNGIIGGANWIACGAIISLMLAYVRINGREISQLLRVRQVSCDPGIFLQIGAMTTLLLYLLGACSHDFNTIRYLLPIWVFVPGLLACVCAKSRFATKVTMMWGALLLSWIAGQSAMATQLGARHPLRPLADALERSRVDGAVSELFDAHILTFLTRQRCKFIEYVPFWSRLAHLPHSKAASRKYLVQTGSGDSMTSWIDSGFPGPPPPETQRFLWPKLRSALIRNPTKPLSRTAYPMGYELIELSEPLHTARPSQHQFD